MISHKKAQKITKGLSIFCGFCAFLWLFPLAAQAASQTVLDGVYSDTQAARGHDFYTSVCGSCHGVALDGVSAPPLTGNRFIERWREGMLDGLYDFIRKTMPFGR